MTSHAHDTPDGHQHGHGHGTAPASAPAASSHADAWDARYAATDRVWSGRPNAALLAEAASLAPGTALELGCGEGADAIWLARRGWRVTAVDFSAVALGRAAGHAADEGVADRIDWQRHELGESFPEGSYDLVCSFFLHSSDGELPRERILRTAAEAVAPGGTLLIVGHSGAPHWDDDAPPLPSPREVLDALKLPEDGWEVLVCEEYEKTRTMPDGEEILHTDNTLKLRRTH